MTPMRIGLPIAFNAMLDRQLDTVNDEVKP
jgi:hypothetical protein